ncbi:chemotaxis protein CheW [Myxococcota bacterium]|nr:chemotaxis protein CheW [Myxococcota bacterium]MBU1429469.1 chemotaxis protein CheW [Myxococcota bacterium]
MSEKQLCAFWVGDYLFGIEVNAVQEVVRGQIETRVPLSSHVIRGLINLRGQVVTVVDMRRCLRFSEDERQQSVYVVLLHDSGTLSLYVDKMMGVLKVSDEQWEKPAEQANQVAQTFIRGVYKLSNQLLFLLDLDKVVRAAS